MAPIYVPDALDLSCCNRITNIQTPKSDFRFTLTVKYRRETSNTSFPQIRLPRAFRLEFRYVGNTRSRPSRLSPIGLSPDNWLGLEPGYVLESLLMPLISDTIFTCLRTRFPPLLNPAVKNMTCVLRTDTDNAGSWDKSHKIR